jgi:hypothetical protein
MTLRKREETGNLKKKHAFALFGELAVICDLMNTFFLNYLLLDWSRNSRNLCGSEDQLFAVQTQPSHPTFKVDVKVIVLSSINYSNCHLFFAFHDCNSVDYTYSRIITYSIYKLYGIR